MLVAVLQRLDTRAEDHGRTRPQEVTHRTRRVRLPAALSERSVCRIRSSFQALYLSLQCKNDEQREHVLKLCRIYGVDRETSLHVFESVFLTILFDSRLFSLVVGVACMGLLGSMDVRCMTEEQYCKRHKDALPVLDPWLAVLVSEGR